MLLGIPGSQVTVKYFKKFPEQLLVFSWWKETMENATQHNDPGWILYANVTIWSTISLQVIHCNFFYAVKLGLQ